MLSIGALRLESPAVMEPDAPARRASTRATADEAAALFEAYGERVRRYIAVRVRGIEEAEDLAADVFRRLLSGPIPEEPAARPAWLFKVAHNAIVDHYRRRRSFPSLVASWQRPDDAPSRLDRAIRDERLRAIDGALARLVSPQRAAIYLRYYEDLEYADIATIMGIPAVTARTLVHRGLRRRLDPAGGGGAMSGNERQPMDAGAPRRARAGTSRSRPDGCPGLRPKRRSAPAMEEPGGGDGRAGRVRRPHRDDRRRAPAHAIAFRRATEEQGLAPNTVPTGDGSVDPRRSPAPTSAYVPRSTNRSAGAPPPRGGRRGRRGDRHRLEPGDGPVAGSPSPAASGSPSRPGPRTSSASPAASGSPSPTIPSVGPTSTVAPSAGATGAPGIPAILSTPLPGSPVVAYWRLKSETAITVTSWAPDGSAPAFSFNASTWQDPDRAGGSVIDRCGRVVSPDGRRVVFAETEVSPVSRAAAGHLGERFGGLDRPIADGVPDLVWSADGTRLVVGSQPAT
jgi:RNA polymerase sigma-70 factor (ECF subfamily)